MEGVNIGFCAWNPVSYTSSCMVLFTWPNPEEFEQQSLKGNHHLGLINSARFLLDSYLHTPYFESRQISWMSLWFSESISGNVDPPHGFSRLFFFSFSDPLLTGCYISSDAKRAISEHVLKCQSYFKTCIESWLCSKGFFVGGAICNRVTPFLGFPC